MTESKEIEDQRARVHFLQFKGDPVALKEATDRLVAMIAQAKVEAGSPDHG